MKILNLIVFSAFILSNMVVFSQLPTFQVGTWTNNYPEKLIAFAGAPFKAGDLDSGETDLIGKTIDLQERQPKGHGFMEGALSFRTTQKDGPELKVAIDYDPYLKKATIKLIVEPGRPWQYVIETKELSVPASSTIFIDGTIAKKFPEDPASEYLMDHSSMEVRVVPAK